MKTKNIFVYLFFSVFCETVCAQYKILTAVMSEEKDHKGSLYESKRAAICCEGCDGQSVTYTDPYVVGGNKHSSDCYFSFQKIGSSNFFFAEYCALNVTNANKDYIDSLKFVFLDRSSLTIKVRDSYYGATIYSSSRFRTRTLMENSYLDDFFKKGLFSIQIITKGGYKEVCYIPLDRACYIARCEMFFFHDIKESESDMYAKLSEYDKKNKWQNAYDGNVRGYLERE